jgi:formate-dependent nitrite reductase membrane component NrfD
MPGHVSIDRRLPDDLRAQTGSGIDVQSIDKSPSYYDVSMLQAPVWEGRLIGTYFFLGGLSGASYLLARMSEIFGGKEYRDVSRAGTTVAMMALLPCAPLLIADLGDPSRFHHMLRVFKPHSPMSLGTWVVSGYGGAAAGAVLREWMIATKGEPKTPPAKALDNSLAVITDMAGVPLALLMMSYTGVLLSATATPVWCRNKWLSPLFTASAIGNGAGAVSLALQFMQRHRRSRAESAGEKVLDRVSTAAHIAEAVLRYQYVKSLGHLAKPLTHGAQKKYMIGSTASLIAAEALKYAPLEGRSRKVARIASALLSVAGGFALKFGITEAGKPSAEDPEQARLSGSTAQRLKDSGKAARKSPLPNSSKASIAATALPGL